MKLYTKEQVREAIDKSKYSRYMFEDEKNKLINSLTPIELPSAKEIQEYINSTPYYGDCTPAYRLGIKDGAKWLKNLIQGSKND